MTGALTLGQETNEKMSMLSPHYDIHSDIKPMRFRNDIKIPDAVVGTMANWIAREVMVI